MRIGTRFLGANRTPRAVSTRASGGADKPSSIGTHTEHTGLGQGQVLGRRSVVTRSLASTLFLAALGGYAGFSAMGRTRGSVVATAATTNGKGKSSLGYELKMSQADIDEAVKGLPDLSVRVTMQVSAHGEDVQEAMTYRMIGSTTHLYRAPEGTPRKENPN